MTAGNVTVLYEKGVKFDMDYYKATHMPLVLEKWGPYGLQSYAVIQFPDDAPYSVQATLNWDSLDSFKKAVETAEAKEVLGDVPNFSDKDPILLAGEQIFTG